LSVVLCSRTTLSVSDSITWEVFCEPRSWASPIIKACNITETPYNILLSPAGVVLGRDRSPVPLLQKLEKQAAD
jgi:hypothetical protein